MAGLKNLRAIREMRGWSQEELAGRCGLSPKTISAYETGRRKPTLKGLEPIAEALGVHASDLLDKEGGLSLTAVELLETLLERLKMGVPEEEKTRLSHLVDLLKLETDKLTNK